MIHILKQKEYREIETWESERMREEDVKDRDDGGRQRRRKGLWEQVMKDKLLLRWVKSVSNW